MLIILSTQFIDHKADFWIDAVFDFVWTQNTESEQDGKERNHRPGPPSSSPFPFWVSNGSATWLSHCHEWKPALDHIDAPTRSFTGAAFHNLFSEYLTPMKPLQENNIIFFSTPFRFLCSSSMPHSELFEGKWLAWSNGHGEFDHPYNVGAIPWEGATLEFKRMWVIVHPDIEPPIPICFDKRQVLNFFTSFLSFVIDQINYQNSRRCKVCVAPTTNLEAQRNTKQVVL